MLFTYKTYSDICRDIIRLGINTVVASEVNNLKSGDRYVCLKHDVETAPDRALSIAKIESEFNIKSTYYFQANLIESSKSIIKELITLGHEIGYHYDVLDEADGEFEKALALFSKSLDKFQKLNIEIKTVCPHGNPTKVRRGWSSNKDFFRNPKIRNEFPNIFDVVVDFEKLNQVNSIYISDAGYSFKLIGDVTENDRLEILDNVISEYNNLIELISTSGSVIISTHPHRWYRTSLQAILRKLVFKILKHAAIMLRRNSIGVWFLNKFYAYAKRF